MENNEVVEQDKLVENIALQHIRNAGITLALNQESNFKLYSYRTITLQNFLDATEANVQDYITAIKEIPNG